MDEYLRKYLNNSSVLRGLPRPASSSTDPVAILLQRKLECPELSSEQASQISDFGVSTITRHLDRRWWNDAKNGYFRFGTIQSYAPKDKTLNVGRFSDFQEGTQVSTFASRSGFYRSFDNGKGGGLFNVGVIGGSVGVKFSVNDFCSCSSIGQFSIDRARLLRSRGNPDIGAYVTYDVSRLVRAFKFLLSRSTQTKGFEVVGRKIHYGVKDRHWQIEETFKVEKHRDPIAIWLSTAFVKSQAYEHEEEYRILVIDPKKVGQLSGAEMLDFRDSSITNAIVDVGEF